MEKKTKKPQKSQTRDAVDLNDLLADIEANIENCVAKLGEIELPCTKGLYYRNMAYEDLRAAMIKINNLRRQLRG